MCACVSRVACNVVLVLICNFLLHLYLVLDLSLIFRRERMGRGKF